MLLYDNPSDGNLLINTLSFLKYSYSEYFILLKAFTLYAIKL